MRGTMNKGWKYRIYPTKEQAAKIVLNIDGAKSVYNAALYKKNESYKEQLLAKAAELGIPLLYKDKAKTELDLSEHALMYYRSALIQKTCEKYDVTPFMKKRKGSEEEYLDTTKTKRAILDKIYDANKWECPLTDKETHDYSAMQKRCIEEGYEFDFTIITESVPLIYFTHGEHSDYYKQLDSNAISGALQNLNTAYKNFFNNLAKGQTDGFPKYKKRGLRNEETNLPNPINITGSYTTCATNLKKGFLFEPYTLKDGRLSQKYEYVKIAKLGPVKMRKHRPFPEGFTLSYYAKVTRETSGNFYIVFNIETAEKEPAKTLSKDSIIGYELSLGHSCVIDSNGKRYNPINGIEKLQEKLKYKQQQLEYMKKGSNNWHKRQFEIQKLHNKITRIKEAQITKIAEDIVKSSDYICFRDVDIKELKKKPVEIDDIELRKKGEAVPEISEYDSENLKKYYRSDRENPATGVADKIEILAKMRRAFQEQCWAKIVDEVEKKAQRDGKVILKTPNKFMSTQICSCCGAVNEGMKGLDNLGEKTFICSVCGYSNEREINSAINIRNICAEQI